MRFFKFKRIERKYRFQIINGSFNNINDKTYGCNNLFLIQKKNIFDGNYITRKDNFRLKHLASDTYFDLDMFKRGN